MSDDGKPGLSLRRGLVICFFIGSALLFGFCALCCGLDWISQVTDPKKIPGIWVNKHGAKITIREDGSVQVQNIHCQVLQGWNCTERRDYTGTWSLSGNEVQFDLRQIQGNDNIYGLIGRVHQLWGPGKMSFFTEAVDTSEFVFVREGP